MIFERHRAACECSYCAGEHRMHYGLNIPAAWKKWNAWYVIKFWPRTYFRWTNSFLQSRKGNG